MNKHLFKVLQEDTITELENLRNKYLRLREFNSCIYEVQKRRNLTLSQYDCFWSWYYHSNVTAREAYSYVFED